MSQAQDLQPEWSSLQVQCVGDRKEFERPCVDSGKITMAFCDSECSAQKRIPSEEWMARQMTPHCPACDAKFGSCHFCRGVQLAARPGWRGVPAPDEEWVEMEA